MNTRGGGVASLPYKECPILFLQQDKMVCSKNMLIIVAPPTVLEQSNFLIQILNEQTAKINLSVLMVAR